MYKYIRLKYLPIKERISWNEELPQWENTKNEIQSDYSQLIDDLYELIPQYAEHADSFVHHEYKIHTIAAEEIILAYDLSDDLEIRKFKIHTETCEIEGVH